MSEINNGLDAKVSALQSEFASLKELIATGFQKAENNFSALKQDVDVTHKKLEALTKAVEELGNNTTVGLDDVGVKIESLTEEIQKIGTVTDYSAQFDNLKSISN